MNNAPCPSLPVLRTEINAPLSRLFDYLPPVDRGDLPRPGCRVLVPFGRRKVTGVVMELGAGSDLPRAKLKRALRVLDEQPLLDEADLRLIRFTSDYYHHPIGEVVAAAVPAPLRAGKPLYGVVRQVTATPQGSALELDALGRTAPRQAALMALLRRRGGTAGIAVLDEALPGWTRVRKALLDRGWIEITERPDDVPGSEATRGLPEPGPALNDDQAAALEAIRSTGGFHVTLLDGITGSGKTEVYLRLIQDVLEQGKQVLVLVPEIGLTPQFLSRLEQRLAIAPVLLHSSLGDAERLGGWRAARDGSAPLILGTRSAVFAPMKNPGLIVVDEEHDSSLKQQEGLRYSARDLAVARAKQLGIPVVLGSATPSLESLQHALDGNYRRLVLPVRAGHAAEPHLRLVDLRQHPAEDGLSPPLLAAIERHRTGGGQVLVFLNRRGFAPTLICQDCGAVAECRRCDARMTVHAAANRLLCHHCGATRPLDRRCAECGGELKRLGQGTQRLELALQARFGEGEVTRIDSDSTRRKGAMTRALAEAAAGDSSILVGTQMLSKGHHFPNLTLVAVIDADQGLFSTDFRGTERLAQSLVQVAGRAGRESRQGEVLIQTSFPTHPFWAALRGGYTRVAMEALEERRLAGWPPFSRLALLRAAATRKQEAHAFLETASRKARGIGADEVRLLGPVSAQMERKAGRYRAQLLLQSASRPRLHALLAALRPLLEADPASRRVRWSIDVDPIELF
ncbi:MAG TPA: primosomal protein N' [Woeseiaceae bacterium]|nr:primosomal protein N' [Woeseiaceae bacterium]